MIETTAEREIEKNNERENKDNKDKMHNDENEDNNEYDNHEEEMRTLNIYEMEKGTISMMQNQHQVAIPNII
eukprot:3212954-Amphidinium_carterae.1